MPRLQSATFASQKSNPVGPGVLIANLVEFTPQGVKDAIGGDEAAGLMLGAMTSAPSVSISREITDRTEDIVGLNAPFKGAQKMQRTDVTLEAELVQMTHKNLKRLHPGLTSANWLNAAHSKITAGTGNSALNVRSLTAGTTTTVNFVISAPSGSTTTVAVTGSASPYTVTVAPKTAATAQEVVDVINLDITASAIVQAGLPKTSDGTGAVAAFTSAALAGGSAGSRIGYTFKPTGFLSDTDYFRNITLCLEGDNTDLLQIWRVDNAIQTDDLDFSPDDEGGVAGVSVTYTGHVTETNYDSTLGTYIPPYAIYNLDTPA